MKSPEQAAFKAILVIAVIIALVALPFVAKGDSHKHGGPPVFTDFDTNGDGFISEEELMKGRAERMAAKAKEGKQMKGAATAPSFSDLDTNGDGMLDEAEFIAGRDAHHKQMHEQHKGKGDGQGKKHGKGMKMPTFGDLDLNGDGCIDAEEFATHQAEMHGKRHGQNTQ